MTAADRDRALRALAQSPLFDALDTAVRCRMIDALALERWPRRTIVMRPERAAERFHVILSGRVRVARQHSRNGREVTLFLLGPGDGFNVVNLLDRRPQEVIAETLDPVEAVSAPMELWSEWSDTYPDFRQAMRRYVDRRMRQLVDLVGDLALHDTRTRLVHLLSRHLGNPGEGPAQPFDLIRDLPHEELAHMIGSVRVVVNRLLAELRRQGIIDTRNGELRVVDLDALLREAEGRVPGP